MNAKPSFRSTVEPWMSRALAPLPAAASAPYQHDSDEAFKIVVTLREAIEAANSAEQRMEGTSDQRYASFLAKARDRHRQIAEGARGLLIEMIVAMSDDVALAKGSPEQRAEHSG
jgi:hypothetical protein